MRNDQWAVEAAHFNRVAEEHLRQIGPLDPLAVARYTSTHLRRRFNPEFRLRSVGDLSGKTVLDVGCGEGLDSVLLATLGAKKVTAIDLSPKALELAEARAKASGVVNKIEFVCSAIEIADVPEANYDIVWCNAILHHLTDNLEPVMRKMSQLTKQGGMISFAEPINFNSTLRRLRKLIPVSSGVATPDERPLEQRDIAVIRAYVPDLQIRQFGLIGRLDQFILTNFNYERSSLPRRLAVNVTGAIDWVLLSLPWFESMGSTAVMWGHPDHRRSKPV